MKVNGDKIALFLAARMEMFVPCASISSSCSKTCAITRLSTFCALAVFDSSLARTLLQQLDVAPSTFEHYLQDGSFSE